MCRESVAKTHVQIKANLRPGHSGSGPIVLGAVAGDLRAIKPRAVERPGNLKGEPFG